MIISKSTYPIQFLFYRFYRLKLHNFKFNYNYSIFDIDFPEQNNLSFRSYPYPLLLFIIIHNESLLFIMKICYVFVLNQRYVTKRFFKDVEDHFFKADHLWNIIDEIVECLKVIFFLNLQLTSLLPIESRSSRSKWIAKTESLKKIIKLPCLDLVDCLLQFTRHRSLYVSILSYNAKKNRFWMI